MSNIVVIKSITDSRVLLIGLTTDQPNVFTTLAPANQIREIQTNLTGNQILERLKVTVSFPEHAFFTEAPSTEPSSLRHLAFFLLTESSGNLVGNDTLTENLIYGLKGYDDLLLNVMRARSEIACDVRICASLLDEQSRLVFLTNVSEASWNTPIHKAVLNSVTQYETIISLLGSNPDIKVIQRFLNKLFELNREQTINWMIEQIKNPKIDASTVCELFNSLRNRGEIPESVAEHLVTSVIDSRQEHLLSANQYDPLIRALKTADHASLSKWIRGLVFDEQRSIDDRLSLFQRLGAYCSVDLDFTRNFLHTFGDNILEQTKPTEYCPLSQLNSIPVEAWLLQHLGDSSQPTNRRINALKLLWGQTGQDDALILAKYINLSHAEPQDLREAATELMCSYRE